MSETKLRKILAIFSLGYSGCFQHLKNLNRFLHPGQISSTASYVDHILHSDYHLEHAMLYYPHPK